MGVHDIPALNACLNAVSTILISAGFVFIRRKNVRAHRACMIAALVVSTLFLVGYVTHKWLVQFQHTSLGATGAVLTFYRVMLISHILLAMVILPLVLWTFSLAITGRYDRHKRWARWTFPIWMYVSVTGVLVYFFLYSWFPAGS